MRATSPRREPLQDLETRAELTHARPVSGGRCGNACSARDSRKHYLEDNKVSQFLPHVFLVVESNIPPRLVFP